MIVHYCFFFSCKIVMAGKVDTETGVLSVGTLHNFRYLSCVN